MKDEKPSYLLTGWLVESMRMTAFHPDGLRNEGVPLWDKIVGEPPESENKQPRLKLLQEDGSWHEGRLLIASTDKRTDIIYNASPEPTDLSFPAIGEYNLAVTRLRSAIDAWLSYEQSTERFAFGMIINQPTEHRISGYTKIGEYLPAVRIDSEGSRDFLYRINRPRTIQLAHAEMAINRLSTWSVSAFSSLTMLLTANRVTTPLRPTNFAVHVELDISTDAEHVGVFSMSESRKIIETIISFAEEIGEKGDVK